MKKTLSLLLAICMLASLCTVPAWAEEDAAMDFPVIEEITAEELEEEFELFADEVVEESPFYAGDSKLNAAEITSGSTEGKTMANLGNLTDGLFPVLNGHSEINSVIYPETGKTAWLTIDLGEARTFSGIRVYPRRTTDGAPEGRNWYSQIITKGYLYVSDDGSTWTKASIVTAANNALYFDATANVSGKVENINARFVKVEAVQTGGGDNNVHWSASELRLLNPVEGKEAITVAQFAEKLASKIVDVPASDDITLIGDIEDAAITYTGKSTDGYIPSLYNGQITKGDDLGGGFIKNGANAEGYMIFKGEYFTIDLGKKMAFSGFRVWESSRTRYFGTEASGKNTPGARRIKTADIQFSDDGTNWYKVYPATAVYNEEGHYSDLKFGFSPTGVMNIEARYLRLYGTAPVAWAEVEMEEIAMLNAVDANPTWSLDGKEIPTSAIDSVVAGSQWNTTSYSAARAWDNDLALSEGHFWHSIPNNPDYDNDEARSLTITLKEKTVIGGIRLWPRNDGSGTTPAQNTATVRKPVLMGSQDGTNWYPITTVSNDLDGQWSKVAGKKYSTPIDIIITGNVDSDLKYIKLVAKKGTSYVCLAEFQLLDASVKGTVSAYSTMDDVVALKSMPSVIGGGNSYDNNWKNAYNNPFDGRVYQNVNKAEGFNNPWTGVASGDPHMEDNHVYFDGKNGSTDIGGPQYAWMDIDLGVAHTFSAVRLFSRWNQSGQSLTKGQILVSEDGKTWYDAEVYSDGYVGSGGMAKYNSTGDIYVDLPIKFGENVNITARYIRIKCLATGGGDHWSWQQLMLVKPDEANETKTVSELVAGFAEDAEAVEALIAEIPAEILRADDAKVAAAEEAYEALTSYAKALVDAEAVAKLEAAVAARNGLVITMASTNNSGLDTLKFTIPARENTTITSVTYVDTLGKTLDGKSATTVAPDGDNLVVSIAGGYTTTTGLTDKNAPDNKYYYGVTRPEFSWWVQGEKVLAEHFTGIYPRLVAADGIGDHFIDVTFEDGVTYKFNLKTTPVWDAFDAPKAIEGSEYTDEITPKTGWKATTTNQNNGMDSAFDGKAEYLLRKAGSDTGNRYESDYVTGKVQDSPTGTPGSTVVMMYKPVRMDFIIDTTEETEVSGIRLYPRVGSYNVDKTKGSSAGIPTKIVYWGSNDGIDWVNLGEYNFGTDITEKTARFTENVSFRYYKGSVLQANHKEYLATVNISELTFLKPDTFLASDAEAVVDISEATEAAFTFKVVEGDSLASVKTEAGADVAYAFENGTLTIDEDYIATLADGTYKFTATFAKGTAFALTVVKKDTSKVTYKVFASNNRGTDALVLNKSNDAAVTGVAIKGGNAITKYTVSEDNKTITIARQNFRKAADLFALTDVDKNGEIQVVVSYEGGEKTYTVTLVAEWAKVLGTTAVYAEDELVADNTKWMARASSVQSWEQPGYALSRKEIATKDAQNWHTFFDGTNGGDSTKAQGHYFDIDFGGNPEPYVGIRHTERPGGTTWNTRVVITAKNNAADEWITIFDGKPAYEKIGTWTNAAGTETVNIWRGDMLFAEPVTYRYLRLHIITASEHITADSVRIIKEITKLESAENVDVDVNYAEEAAYSFHVVGTPVVSVAVGAEALEADAYTFENGVLTLTPAFTGTLPAGKTDITVTINGKAFTVSVTRVDKYAATYTLADGANVRGTDNLVLPVVGDAVPTKVMYGEVEVPFTFADGKFTIKRNDFRSLDDLFDMDEIVLAVTFGEEVVKNYTVTLVNNGITLTGVSTAEGAFASDEIKPVDGEWTIKASSGHASASGAHTMFTMTSNGLAWHSAYTEISGSAVPDSKIGRKYIEVNFGEATKISGFRYYLRQDKDGKGVLQTAGTWNGATIYGRNSADAEWTLIKSQSFIFDDIIEKTYAEVYFSEDVTYNEVRIVIDCGDHATGRGFTFLNARPAAPEPEEDEVNIQITPTTGGNVTVDEVPSQGDNYVAANQEVTFVANPDSSSSFMYWVEANTGKILGTGTSLAVISAAGKDIKAVFADPSSAEAFVSFFGRNAKSVISHSYVKKGATPKAPAADKLYTTGYNFLGWVTSADAVENATAEDLVTLGAINENASYYAVYEAKTEKKNTITVTGGMIKAVEGGTFATEGTFAYDTPVTVKANSISGQKFSHWTINDKIVSYKSTYSFFAPDDDITLVANFVADDAVVKEAVTITMTKTLDEVNGVKVASFLTTRYVPAGTEVLETGVIYVKDASYSTLSIAEIGKTSAAGKAVKVATSDKKTSGQYKLTASYVEGLGIKAVGFITYVEGGKVTTIYTAEMSQK